MLDDNPIPGHALLRGGKPYGKVETSLGVEVWEETGALGYAVCECGETSMMLDSTSARRHWHRQVHERAVLAAQKQQAKDDSGETGR